MDKPSRKQPASNDR